MNCKNCIYCSNYNNVDWCEYWDKSLEVLSNWDMIGCSRFFDVNNQ